MEREHWADIRVEPLSDDDEPDAPLDPAAEKARISERLQGVFDPAELAWDFTPQEGIPLLEANAE